MKKTISDKFSMSEKNLNEKNQEADSCNKGLAVAQKPAQQLRGQSKILKGLSLLAQEARTKYFTDVAAA